MEAGGLEKLRRRFWIERGAYLFVILVLLAANFWGEASTLHEGTPRGAPQKVKARFAM